MGAGARGSLRILTTNDFVGSFFPQRASWGRLPGAVALRRTIAALRDGRVASAWIDTGDLVQGSPLGPLTDGAWGFLAGRGLGVDVGVVGNHELDWGLTHLRRFARELPFPLLAANAGFGFAPTALLHRGGWRIGVIGISYPQMAFLHPDRPTEPDTAAVVRRHAASLRAEAADLVVLALHDGVDLGLAGEDGAAPPCDPARIERLLAAFDGAVDLVLGGHTLGRWCGRLAGVPFVQPWPFGTQVGVADVIDGEIALTTVDVAGEAPWDGPGAGVHAALAAEVVGVNPLPLASAPGRDVSLAQAIADGLLACDETVDVAVVGPRDVWTQAPRDGAYAQLPAGPVSLAEILRLAPCSGARSAWGGQLLVAEVGRADAERMVHELADARYAPGVEVAMGAAAVARRDPAAARQRIAVPPFCAARLDATLGRRFAWTIARSSWRDALLAQPWIEREAATALSRAEVLR